MPRRALVSPWARAAMLALAAAGAGCAGYTPQVQPGSSAEQVLAANGPPTGRYALADGASRWEYARGPYGKHTWMVDFSAEGRVTAVQQVLTEARFFEVRPGEALSDVQARLGRPAQRRPVGWRGDHLWAWRYEAVFCQWFVITETPDGRVRDAGFAPDPLCDDDDRPTLGLNRH